MTKTNAEKQRDFKARQAAKGLSRVSVWVYGDDQARLIREYAATLRQEQETNSGN